MILRWMAVAAVTSLGAAAPDAPVRPDPLEPEPPHRLRGALELGAVFAVAWSTLWLTPPPEADPPGNVSVWKKLSLQGVSFDVSSFETNFAVHALAGNINYGIARANGIGPSESFLWGFAISTLWELFEFPETFSINDAIVTPVGGAAIGESLYQLSAWLDVRHPGAAGAVTSTVFAPARRVNGTRPGPEGGGMLGLRTIASAGGLSAAGRWHPLFGVAVTSRVTRLEPSAAGVGWSLRGDSPATELALEASGTDRGVADFHFGSRAWFATANWKELVSTDEGVEGVGLLAGLGPGYEFRLHRWELDRPEPLDSRAEVYVPGTFVELRRLGALALSARVDAALAFGGTRSFVIDGDANTLALESLPTPMRAYGYYFAWGPSLAAAVKAGFGALTLAGGARWSSSQGIMHRDVWPGRHPTADLGDGVAEVSARLGFRVPERGLELSASASRGVRWGHAGDAQRSARQTELLLGFGLALP